MPRPGASMVIPSHAFNLRGVLGSKLKMDFNSDIGLQFGTGSNVNTWLDQSGNSFNLTQATTTQQPVAVPSVSDGHTAIRFDGSNDFLHCSGLTGFTSGSAAYYIVWADRQGIASYQATMFDFSIDGTSANRGQTYLHNSNYHSFRNLTSQTAGDYVEIQYIDNNVNTDVRLWAMRFTGSAFTAEVNGVQVQSVTHSGQTLVAIPTAVRVGQLIPSGLPMKGDVYRLICCNPGPSASEHTALMNYFKRQFPSAGIVVT